jgi:hypothetical protein
MPSLFFVWLGIGCLEFFVFDCEWLAFGGGGVRVGVRLMGFWRGTILKKPYRILQ